MGQLAFADGRESLKPVVQRTWYQAPCLFESDFPIPAMVPPQIHTASLATTQRLLSRPCQGHAELHVPAGAFAQQLPGT